MCRGSHPHSVSAVFFARSKRRLTRLPLNVTLRWGVCDIVHQWGGHHPGLAVEIWGLCLARRVRATVLLYCTSVGRLITRPTAGVLGGGPQFGSPGVLCSSTLSRAGRAVKLGAAMKK